MKHKIVVTSDGSPTIFIPELGEHYHSIHGAYTESMHVFIHAGLHLKLQGDIQALNILEVGLGTGLNVILSAREANNFPHKITYHALEPFPIETELLAELKKNFIAGEISDPAFFEKIHLSDFNDPISLQANFLFEKFSEKLENFIPCINYDLVYFDAFGPQFQPEVWTPENFEKIAAAMAANGILVTYCAKGSVRRNMLAAGLKVERIAGPPGKREMLRAIKL